MRLVFLNVWDIIAGFADDNTYYAVYIVYNV